MDAKSQQIFNYLASDLLKDKRLNDQQLQNAYVNVRLWLDSKGVSQKADGSPTADAEITAIENNKAEVTAVALNPSYEEDLNKAAASKEVSTNSVAEKNKVRLKIGAFVALLFLAFYLLLKDGGGEPSIE